MQDRVAKLQEENVQLGERLLAMERASDRTYHEGDDQKPKSQRQFYQSDVSYDNIDGFVREQLQRPEINISWLPDSVERKIYVNVIYFFYKMFGVFCDRLSNDLGGGLHSD